MSARLAANPGSFRDPVNQIYEISPPAQGGRTRIVRGLSDEANAVYERLAGQDFYKRLLSEHQVVSTSKVSEKDPDAKAVLSQGWHGVIEHETIPFISYPYEWTFSMLKDAALLQLSLIERSLANGWAMKDATPYNVQFIGANPIFIDIASFEPREKGEHWVGYRQFCSMFLTPLMLRAHLGIDHNPLLRSYIDGIEPTEAAKYFRGIDRLRKGVLSHIVLPARVERGIEQRERDGAPPKQRSAMRQSDAMVIGLVQSLTRLVSKLKTEIQHTDWSMYDKTHSYQAGDFESKKSFIIKHLSSRKRDQVWDIGCNTGTFSKLCAEHCNQVIAVDGDHDSVETLYLELRDKKRSNILPLVMDLSNISPAQGWAGAERQAFDRRKKPDLVVCLALIHHIRLSANIPNRLFLEWLHSLQSEVILEFVDRTDEMVIKLLTNKKEQYEDYNRKNFLNELKHRFSIIDSLDLKGGKRTIYFLKPKN